MDPGLNQLLQWSIENSDVSKSNPVSASPAAMRPLDAAALKALMGGPSEADMMRESMAAIQSADISLDNKLVAFDNLEQLIESLDNANNLEPLGLWAPLVGLLGHEEGELRRMAAWCVGTAVQNNVKAQERAMVVGAIPMLVKMTVEETQETIKRKAIYALSSEVRNYQPAIDEAIKALPEALRPTGQVDAGDMDTIDELIEKLRQPSS